MSYPTYFLVSASAQGGILLTLLRWRKQKPEEREGGAVGKDGAKL